MSNPHRMANLNNQMQMTKLNNSPVKSMWSSKMTKLNKVEAKLNNRREQ